MSLSRFFAVSAVLASTLCFADEVDKDCMNEWRITEHRCPELLQGLSCKATREKVGEVYQRCGDEWEAKKAAKAAREAEAAAAAQAAAAPTLPAAASTPGKAGKAGKAGKTVPAATAPTPAGAQSPTPGPGTLKAGQGVGRRTCTGSSAGVDIDVTSDQTIGVSTCRGAIEKEFQDKLCKGKAKGTKLSYSWQFADTTGQKDLRCR